MSLPQRAKPSPLWLGIFPKRRTERGTTRISRVPCEKAKRGCASRVPLPPGVTACRARGVLVERATPPFSPLVRHRRGKRCRQRCRPFASPFGEVALCRTFCRAFTNGFSTAVRSRPALIRRLAVPNREMRSRNHVLSFQFLAVLQFNPLLSGPGVDLDSFAGQCRLQPGAGFEGLQALTRPPPNGMNHKFAHSSSKNPMPTLSLHIGLVKCIRTKARQNFRACLLRQEGKEKR